MQGYMFAASITAKQLKFNEPSKGLGCILEFMLANAKWFHSVKWDDCPYWINCQLGLAFDD